MIKLFNNTSKNIFTSILLSLVLLCPALAHSAPWEVSYAQGLIGIQDMDEAWTIDYEDGSSTTARDDLIYLGGLAQYNRGEGLLQFGFEAGGLLTVQNDINYFFISSGGLYVEVSAKNDFWTLDMFAGAYLSLNPTPYFRLYAAAGPTLMWGSLSMNEDDVEITPFDNEGSNITINLGGRQNASDLGLYGRVGVDFVPMSDLVIGLSARKINGELDFDNNGIVTLDDTQYFLTFTRRY